MILLGLNLSQEFIMLGPAAGAPFPGPGATMLTVTYMKIPTDFWAMSRNSRGKMPMWKSAQTLIAMTTA